MASTRWMSNGSRAAAASARTRRIAFGAGSLALLALAGVACAPSADDAAMAAEGAPMVDLLGAGEALFGMFSGDHDAAGGAAMAENEHTDFVFYSLESGPFDIPTMETYMAALAEASDLSDAPPLALRIPPVHEDPDGARARVAEGLAAGVASIVFPHVVAREDAEVAVDAMGSELWPGNPDGSLVAMLIVEDREGIANVRDIVSTPGVSVVFAGPGDLSRAYDRDEEAVENAIQTVLAACVEFDVPCGITAGVDDVAERLEQGFRVFIVNDAETVTAGKRAAGRME